MLGENTLTMNSATLKSALHAYLKSHLIVDGELEVVGFSFNPGVDHTYDVTFVVKEREEAVGC